MQPDRNRFGKIRLADNDGDLIRARRVAEHNETRRDARRERDQRLTCDSQRVCCINRKAAIASASTATIDWFSPMSRPIMLAASTAGRPLVSLMSWMAATEAGLAALAIVSVSLFLSATRSVISPALRSSGSRTAIGAIA